MSSLINCVVQPLESYGLYRTYGQELFCLLSRVCINVFAWEINTKSSYRLVTLSNIESYMELLEQVDITESPEIFYKKLVTNKSLVTPYENHQQLVEVAELRLLQWKHRFRGKLNESEIQFRSKINPNQERKLNAFLIALFGEKYESIKSVLPNRSASVISHHRFR